MNRHFIAGVGVCLFGIHTAFAASASSDEKKLPNILYIMSDDHASQAISAYNGILSGVIQTPNIDRIANEGVRLDNCFVTNSISAPSRGAIITGQYSQKNGVYTLRDRLDPDKPNVAKELQQAGYVTGIVGKWHLSSEPTGFDFYNVLPGQGRYRNPILIEKGYWGSDRHTDKGNRGKEYEGHSTDIIASQAIRFMEERDKEKPFFLMCHFKAPHRSCEPAERFKDLLKGGTLPEPDNLLDTYEGKGKYVQSLRMSMEDLNETDLKTEIPEGLTRDEQRRWAYQIYLKDYLRCIAGIDENVGRLLKYLDDNNLTENTIVVYTSDQGFFLGEHGWFDKRLMFEECLRMPFVMRYPKEIEPGCVNKDMILNIDFAPMFLDYAGIQKPVYMQGESFRKNLLGKTPRSWRNEMYYRYWMHADPVHNVPAHYGIRTDRYKLVFFYGDPLDMSGTRKVSVKPAEWELYDLQEDPKEMYNIYSDPAYQSVVKRLKKHLLKLKKEYGDEDCRYPVMQSIYDKYYW